MKDTQTFMLGAAVALLNACAPVVNAPEPVFLFPRKSRWTGRKWKLMLSCISD